MTEGDNGIEVLNKHMKEQGYLKKDDLDSLIQSTKDLTVHELIKHEDCGGESCDICSMKKNIDTGGFTRGAQLGIQVGQKFPHKRFDFG